MPFKCEHCGKEHKTQEELEAEGEILKEISTLDEEPGGRMMKVHPPEVAGQVVTRRKHKR